jgi:hypothetical protein
MLGQRLFVKLIGWDSGFAEGRVWDDRGNESDLRFFYIGEIGIILILTIKIGWFPPCNNRNRVSRATRSCVMSSCRIQGMTPQNENVFQDLILALHPYTERRTDHCEISSNPSGNSRMLERCYPKHLSSSVCNGSQTLLVFAFQLGPQAALSLARVLQHILRRAYVLNVEFVSVCRTENLS